MHLLWGAPGDTKSLGDPLCERAYARGRVTKAPGCAPRRAQVGVRQKLIGLLPRTLTLSMAAGIGLFLAHIGYQAGEGLGLVVADGATLVTLGAQLGVVIIGFC